MSTIPDTTKIAGSKNITLYIPAELATKMGSLKDVNWSQIAREAIQRYVEEHLNSTIPADILNKLRKEMDDDFTNGKKLALEELAPKVAYRTLEGFFAKSNSIAYSECKDFANEMGIDIEEAPYNLEGAAIKIIKDYFNEIPKDASSRFCKGVFMVLNEVWNKIPS